ncbi:MAG: hypothetical protein JWO86_7429, partial [Myxococcaceae bacterium]|nr:hypothetical protein [Myxococcaceae bacterium]
ACVYEAAKNAGNAGDGGGDPPTGQHHYG